MLSMPPVWISKVLPRYLVDMAEHSICQPGLPSPISVAQKGSPPFFPFHRAKSRTSSFSYSIASTVAPGFICERSIFASFHNPWIRSPWNRWSRLYDKHSLYQAGFWSYQPFRLCALWPWIYIGSFNPEKVHFLEKEPDKFICILPEAHALFLWCLDCLVIKVCQVHDLPDCIALEFKIAPEHIRKDVRPEVADMSETINRRTAGIYACKFIF